MKIGIMGAGHYGNLLRRLIRRYTADVDVVMYDKHRLAHGVHYSVIEVFEHCDAIIFAVPMEQLESAVTEVLALQGLRVDAVFVNVCSEQAKSGEAMARLCGKRPYISAHSPWGPEAYRLVNEVVSLLPAIALTHHTLDQHRMAEIVGFVKDCGFQVTARNADDHDKTLAGRQMFVTHLISQTLKRMNGMLEGDCSASPLSFQDLVRSARTVQNDEYLFLDLWTRVPECDRTFELFIAAVRDLEKMKIAHASGK